MSLCLLELLKSNMSSLLHDHMYEFVSFMDDIDIVFEDIL